MLVRKQKSNDPKKKRSVVDRIAPIGFDKNEGININVYGRSGTGKTTLWATFPGKILCILCSGGQRPGELRSIDTPEYRKKILAVAVHHVEELRDVLDHARDGDYATVVIDHASGLQDIVLKDILGIDDIPAQRSWGMATQQDWGQCALQTKEILRTFLGLSCNRVLVAQEREFNTDQESSQLMPYVASALSPSTVGWLNPACDYIVRTFLRQRMGKRKVKIGGKVIVKEGPAKGVDYCLQVAPHPIFTTKFRVPRGTELPDVIVDPSYAKIMALIQGGE